MRHPPTPWVVAAALVPAAWLASVGLPDPTGGERALPPTGVASRLPPPAPAGALLVHRTVEELAAEADRVVTGRVVGLRSRLSPAAAAIETHVTLQVERVYKGPAADRLTVTVPGGEVAGLRQWEGGVPNFLVGERVLLFLLEGPRFGLGLAELWQGKYSLDGDEAVQPETGGRVSLRHLEERISRGLGSPAQIPRGGSVIEASFAIWNGCAWAPGDLPVPYYVNPDSPGPGGTSGAAFVSMVQRSHEAWQDLPDSDIAFRYAGTATRTGPGSSLDGNNDVRWANLDSYGSGVLGINTCYSTGTFRLDSDTRIDNTGFLWDADDSDGITPGSFSLQSVTEHELGHALGLAHSTARCDGSPSTPLMCPAISSGVRKRIMADDRAGAATLYPPSAEPTPTSTPTPTATQTPAATNTPTAAATLPATPTATATATATVTATVVPVPTMTPTPGPDSDGDGCTDAQELGPDPFSGGGRDPLDPWDFYDIPVRPGVGTLFDGATLADRDRAVSVVSDVLAVLEYAGTSSEGNNNAGPDGIAGNADDRGYSQDHNADGQPDGRLYDRSPGAPWSAGPDGSISLGTDVLLVLAQAGHSCQGAALAVAGLPGLDGL